MLAPELAKTRQKLLSLFPIPDVTGVKERHFSFDGGGRELVEELIDEIKPSMILEIGHYLGGSALRWMRQAPEALLVAVDPWQDRAADAMSRYLDVPFFIKLLPDREERLQFIEDVRQQTFFRTAVANMGEVLENFVPVRNYSPEILPTLKWCGLEPDMIYNDAMKHGADLEMCTELWPKARICGDDWTWGADQGYPMRTNILQFAEKKGLEVEASRATWIIRAAS